AEDTSFFAAPLPPAPTAPAASAHPPAPPEAVPPQLPPPYIDPTGLPERPPLFNTAPPPAPSDPYAAPELPPPPVTRAPPPPASMPTAAASPRQPPEEIPVAPPPVPRHPIAPPPVVPANNAPNSYGILAVGIAAAAVAIVSSIGIAGFVFQQQGTPPAVASASEEASPVVADVALPVEKPVAPEFSAKDTGSPAADRPPKQAPKAEKGTAATTAPSAAKPSPRPIPSARRPRPPRIPAPALPTPPPATPQASSPSGTADIGSEPGEPELDLDQATRTASTGRLDPSTRRSLEALAIDNPDYTRARTLLAVDAAQRGDAASAERYLEQTMSLPENRYNPVLLSQLALHQVNRQRYASALNNANRAEQHWARLPSNVMFERKAIIYEVQAAATQGLLYEADSDQQQKELVNDALRRWTRFREHATSGSSTDQIVRADQQIEKLTSIRSRLE
ncbi:MAG: hypothetical protein CL927_05505, partial [Deltaproteobacteria bacterium]|nr:hypothetical protein [Deltaproteobacteria bacterium]